MPTWEDITSSFKKGVNFVENKSKEILAVTHLNAELNQLNKEKDEKLWGIGKKIYQLTQEGKFNSPETDGLVREVLEYEQKITAKKAEIARIRQTSKEQVKSQPAGPVSVQSECGHSLPEGANYCPFCGRRINKE